MNCRHISCVGRKVKLSGNVEYHEGHKNISLDMEYKSIISLVCCWSGTLYGTLGPTNSVLWETS